MNKKFASSIRKFLFLSIDVQASHSFSRPPLESSSAIARLNKIFHCTAVVIAVEGQDGAFRYHLAVENTSASRYTALRLIQEAFPEVVGNLKVQFAKSWGWLSDFLTSGDREIKEVWGRYTKDQIVEIATLKKKKKMKKGSLFVPEITESFPMSEEQKLSPLIVGDEQAESSLLSLSEVEERVCTYLEQHGWPEEYELEFLLEHYALLDWLAVSLSFQRPQSTKNLIIYGRIQQAKKRLLSLKRVLRIHFADSSLNSLSGASNQDDLLVFDDFQLIYDYQYDTEENTTHLNNLLQVLDGEESFLEKKCNINKRDPY